MLLWASNPVDCPGWGGQAIFHACAGVLLRSLSITAPGQSLWHEWCPTSAVATHLYGVGNHHGLGNHQPSPQQYGLANHPPSPQDERNE